MMRWQLQLQETVPLLTRALGSSSLFSPFHRQRRPLLHPRPLPPSPPPPPLSSVSSTFVVEHPRQQWGAVHFADHRRAVSGCRRAGFRHTWDEGWRQWGSGSRRGSPRRFPWGGYEGGILYGSCLVRVGGTGIHVDQLLAKPGRRCQWGEARNMFVLGAVPGCTMPKL